MLVEDRLVKDANAMVECMPMKLEEAIEHARDVGIKMMSDCSTVACSKEHLQLAVWLNELLQFRKAYGAQST